MTIIIISHLSQKSIAFSKVIFLTKCPVLFPLA
nr:MAG TPA: hypothetical protein [Caudoviricetes sp.]